MLGQPTQPGDGTGGVLLVGPLPEPPLTGGVEIGVSMLLRSPTARRHRMQLFNTARRRDPSRPLWERLTYQLRKFVDFVGALRRQKPDTVHVKASWGGVNFAQSIGYCMLARLFGRRVLVQLHGGSFDTWYCNAGRPAKTAIRIGLSSASEIVVLSEYWRAMVRELLPSRPVHVVPNGVELENAVPPRSRGGELRILTIGTVCQRKGHFDIVRAAARVKDLPVRFVFGGPDENIESAQALRSLIAALGTASNIEFLGPVGSDEKWKQLAEADIYLLPSHGENMPNAILEAMATGLPIVLSRAGAMPEMLVDGESGVFVDAGDSDAISAAVRRLARSRELRRALAAGAHARVQARYAFGRIAERFDALYEGAYDEARFESAVALDHDEVGALAGRPS
ncbi:MAG: glycosyltransferase family 1 protein [Myxococcales bacterium]|nr:MAG: glycosyltransferase family 1 protein [Myxococcales bacterium]